MTDKLKYSICILLSITSGMAHSQGKKLRKADGNFKLFNYSKAITQYENLVENGTSSKDIYLNLGDANYFNANYKDAARWYGMLSEIQGDALDLEHKYRYANSLRSIQKYDESNQLLSQVNTIRALKNPLINQGGDAIEKRYGSYRIEQIEINTSEPDFAPSFRLDGLVFSTGRGKSTSAKSFHNWNKKRFLNLYTATNTADAGFKNIMRFSDKLNTKFHESSTAFTKDGMTVYFTRNKENGNKFGRDRKGISQLKLYSAVLEKGKWTKIKELPFNREGYSAAHPSLNKTEDKLYFAADFPGTQGQSDIFVVDINSDGTFGTPVNLGPNINTGGRETFPYITADDVIYFASDGHKGLGGLDIFAANLNKLKTSKIVNLGEPLNSNADDFSFIVNSITKKGYFASNRKGGMGDDDIYALTEVKPIDTRCFSNLSGVVKDKGNGTTVANATVLLIDDKGNKMVETTSNNTGSFTLEAECSMIDYVIVATKDQHEPDQQSISSRGIDKADITLMLTRINTGAPIGSNLVKYLNISPLYFDLDKSFIREDAKATLEKIITYMNTYPEAKIEVRSHTDSRASSSYNKSLSERRAKETVNYLTNRGIASIRIIGKGYGESQLTNDCDDTTKCPEHKHSRNRRSEFILVE